MPYLVLRKGPLLIMISSSEKVTLLQLSLWVSRNDFYVERDWNKDIISTLNGLLRCNHIGQMHRLSLSWEIPLNFKRTKTKILLSSVGIQTDFVIMNIRSTWRIYQMQLFSVQIFICTYKMLWLFLVLFQIKIHMFFLWVWINTESNVRCKSSH